MTQADELAVNSQVELPPLRNHASGSRMDIEVRLRSGKKEEIVFIESKVGSTEGSLQLERYAEHLAQQKGVHHRALLYITRDYDPKVGPNIPSVTFKVARWSSFYRHFQPLAASDTMLAQLLRFMEEHRMSQTNLFTPLDLVALTNFSSARGLMDSTMWENRVAERFEAVTGRRVWKDSAMPELRKHKRYAFNALQGPGGQMSTVLGYWLDQELPTDSPWVGMMIYVSPKAQERPAIVEAMHAFVAAKAGLWESFGLTDTKEWGGMFRGCNLQDFLSKPDHTLAISNAFLEILAEVDEFKSSFPKLPWTALAETNSPE